ncbi:MAG: DUF3021 family protein [Roseburia sp.]
MEERLTVFTYIKQVFKMYGLTVLIFILFSEVIGDLAMGHSSLFSLGREGLSMDTLLQLLGFIVCVVALEFLFLKSRVLKIASVAVRSILFLISTVILVAGCAILFGWFPAGEAKAWIGFGISFVICFLISFLFSYLEEKSENQKMADALDRMKNRQS